MREANLKGKIALDTGGSRGIGAAISDEAAFITGASLKADGGASA